MQRTPIHVHVIGKLIWEITKIYFNKSNETYSVCIRWFILKPIQTLTPMKRKNKRLPDWDFPITRTSTKVWTNILYSSSICWPNSSVPSLIVIQLLGIQMMPTRRHALFSCLSLFIGLLCYFQCNLQRWENRLNTFFQIQNDLLKRKRSTYIFVIHLCTYIYKNVYVNMHVACGCLVIGCFYCRWK